MTTIKKIKDSAGNVHDIIDTDTKNTAGSTNTASKIFLVGATSQAANPQTYSNSKCYVGTDNCLYSNGTKVLTSYTNTKNTAGSTDTDSKIFLVGATEQSANPQTYSHVEVYIDTDHSLHAEKFYQNSDERLKTFTEDYDINLDDIKNIRTGRFYWNTDENQEINCGVTAQTVETYFPELISENEDGIKSVNYDGLAVVAIAAIKKLTERIEQLEDIIRNK